jgi:hypothetical protein
LNGTFLSTSTFTCFADDGFGKSEFLDFAFVEVFKGDGDSVDQILSTSRSGVSRAYTDVQLV